MADGNITLLYLVFAKLRPDYKLWFTVYQYLTIFSIFKITTDLNMESRLYRFSKIFVNFDFKFFH